jgi:hypothetical protein
MKVVPRCRFVLWDGTAFLHVREVRATMNDILSRASAVNPLVWVALTVAAVLGFGAQKIIERLNIPEDNQLKNVIILKSAALLLVILVFIFIVTTT